MPPAASERRFLDPHVWKVCAGSSVEIPPVGSRVYYFPQGHSEQASSPPDFSSVLCKDSFFLCTVKDVRFLANYYTDEVFAKTELIPIMKPREEATPPTEKSLFEAPGNFSSGDVVSFAKILTSSDANNGGGFSVPRFCATSIFPPLDQTLNTPVQQIFVQDVHGKTWEFRHIYRGTPRRHLLTTGWSKFVNHKKLVAGDSVVFVRKSSSSGQELFVGVRRARRSCGPTDYLRYAGPTMGHHQHPEALLPSGANPEEEGIIIGSGGSSEGFSRNCRGRVPPASVVEAVRRAESGRPFETMYYPRAAGSPNFVVRAEVVEESLRSVLWSPGLTVRMAVETEDSSKMTWFQGVVSCTEDVPGLDPRWPRSPWRMLQVTWDEPEVLQNLKTVSPWQVELVLPTSNVPSPYPPNKKIRASHGPELLPDGEHDMFIPMPGFTSAMMGSLNPSLFGYYTFPAGMQGARHDLIHNSSFSKPSNFITIKTQPVNSDNLCGNNMPQKVNDVPTELGIRCDNLCENNMPQKENHVPTESGIRCTSRSQSYSPTRPVTSDSFLGDMMPQKVDRGVSTELSIGNTQPLECTSRSQSYSPTRPVTSDSFLGDMVPQKVDRGVSTELSIGNTQPLECSSSSSHGSIGFVKPEPFGSLAKTIEATGDSIRLFGKTFQANLPTKGDDEKESEVFSAVGSYK